MGAPVLYGRFLSLHISTIELTHRPVPYFYIPEKDIRPTAPGVDWVTESEEDAFCSVKIVVRTPDDEKPIDAILFKDGPLRGLVKIYHHFIGRKNSKLDSGVQFTDCYY